MVHSHPTWLVSRWIKQFGQEEAVQLMQHNNRCVGLCVREDGEIGAC